MFQKGTIEKIKVNDSYLIDKCYVEMMFHDEVTTMTFITVCLFKSKGVTLTI